MNAPDEPMAVFIVDDSAHDRAETKAALLRGWARRIAFSEFALGRDAVEACKAAPPACMLLDLRLPDMDALEVLSCLRAPGNRFPPFPTVIVTGFDQEAFGHAALHAGAMGFIGKGWLTPSSLARTIEAAIERHALYENQTQLLRAAAEREQRLQLALQAGHAGTFFHDLTTDKVTWSFELERIIGYAPGAFPGTFGAFLVHVHPDDIARVRETIMSAIDRADEYVFEFRVVRTDGRIVWLAGRGRPYASRGGAIDTITGVAFDITERKRADEALRYREHQLNLAQRAAGLGLWDWDVVADRATWSDRAWELFEPGATGGVITYERWLSRVHPEDRDRAAQASRRGLAESHYKDEFRVVHSDGTVRWLEVFGESFKGADGRPLRMIGVARDITERKLTEAALVESESRFREMAETMPAVVFTWTADGRCDWVNRSWQEYTGGMEFSDREWAKSIHEGDHARVVAGWEESVQTGAPFSSEYRCRKADGSYGWHWSRAVPLRNASGVVERWVGTSTDVTAIREAVDIGERLLVAERSAREQAETANALKDEFLAVLAHELRTPLGNVMSWTQVLQTLLKHEGGKVARALKIILDNGIMQSKLIDDLLDVNRIVRGMVKLEKVPVPLSAFVDECVSAQRATAEAGGLSLVLDQNVAPDDLVAADPTRLRQVLGNLIANAIKFTPAGGLIGVRVSGAPGGYEIVVRDTGRGISPEELPHVFERFRQVDGHAGRRGSGLGLGLAIVKQLTLLHGGRASAHSDGTGRGATFTIFLPRLVVSDTGAGAETDSAAEADPRALKGVRAIVVGGEPEAVASTRRLLVEHGAMAHAFSSGPEALAMLRGFAADVRHAVVLVADLASPTFDGVALLRSIRDELALGPERMPAIALADGVRGIDPHLALTSGFQAYLMKPFATSQLVESVRALGWFAKRVETLDPRLDRRATN